MGWMPQPKDKDWLNGYKNKTHIYTVYKKPTSDLKTHINQINKDQTQRTNIKSSKGKTINNTQEDSHKDYSWSFDRNSSGQKGMAGYIYSNESEKSTTKITVPGKDLIQNWWRNQKLFRQAKVKRIQYHQASFTIRLKGLI